MVGGYARGMTTEREENEPNEFGFAGEPSLPEPEPAAEPESAAEPVPHLAEGEGERIAVPSGDLTGAITEAIEEATDHERH